MTITEMKHILADKFKDEQCTFTVKDIVIKKLDKHTFNIYIKDYEHIVFVLMLDYDDYFGYGVFITNEDMRHNNDDILVDDDYEYNYKTALIKLGYYISTRF